MADGSDWPLEVYGVFGALGIRQVAYVPDAGLTRLIRLCQADAGMRTVPLTTEEEGVAMVAGAWLGGERGILLMQSSGIGNCLNMLSLVTQCRFPLPMVVTMRGQWGEFNPWQVPMGQNGGTALALAGTQVYAVDEAARIGETVEAGTRLAFESGLPVAVLIGQRVIGTKTFAQAGHD